VRHSVWASMQAGVLAGGLTDGSICLWNPAKVLRSPAGSADEGAGAAVATLRKHTGPVKVSSATHG